MNEKQNPLEFCISGTLQRITLLSSNFYEKLDFLKYNNIYKESIVRFANSVIYLYCEPTLVKIPSATEKINTELIIEIRCFFCFRCI